MLQQCFGSHQKEELDLIHPLVSGQIPCTVHSFVDTEPIEDLVREIKTMNPTDVVRGFGLLNIQQRKGKPK